MAQRIKTVQESDLRMLGALARSIQRVLPVTQEDIDAAAALGKGWVVTRVFEVTDPLDNLRGGTQLVIRQNSVLPGQSVQRVLLVSGPGGQTVVVRGSDYIALPDAIADSLSYVKAFGGTEQRDIPDNYLQRQFIYMMDDSYLVPDITPEPDWHIEMDFQTTSVSTAGVRDYFGGRYDSSAAGAGIRLSHTSSRKVVMYGFDTNNAYTGPSYNMADNTRYKYVYNNNSATLSTGGTVVDSTTFTPNDTTTSAVGINSYRGPSGSYSSTSEGIYLYSFKAWNGQDELVMDLVPAVQKGTVPVVGFYDTVSKTFKTATAGTFAAGGEAVPTPDAPMDIVSNNGVLKARHQSGLPLGYTLLDYIESSGTQYIDTSVYISTGYKVRVKAYATSLPTTSAFFGCTSTAEATNARKGIYRIIGGTINRCAWGDGNGSVIGSLSGNDSLNTWYDMVCDNGVWTINDTLFATCPEVSFTSEYSMWLFARNTGGTVGLPASCRISVCQIWDNNGQMIRNLVPAKNSSNVVGMYDLVSGQFLTNQGTGDFTAGNPVSDPVEIYTDGTVETLQINTLPAGYIELEYIESSGTQYIDPQVYGNARWVITAQTNAIKGSSQSLISSTSLASGGTWYGEFTTKGHWDVVSNGTNIPSTTKTTADLTFDSDGARGTIGSTSVDRVASVTQGTWRIFVTSGGSYPFAGKLFDAKVYQGGVLVRDFVPAKNSSGVVGIYDLVSGQFFTNQGTGDFVAGTPTNTATAEMLLKVGDYQDVQSIIDGVVTRNVGIKVLDGTENWSVAHAATYTYTTNISNAAGQGSWSNLGGLCSHLSWYVSNTTPSYTNTNPNTLWFNLTKDLRVKTNSNFATLTDWTNYLKAQYAAGTPVIVIYPLATATTESVTGQTLQVQEGNNIVEITQASLNNLELEAKYQAAVSLTIQEVQDANLDPNVQVTIN